MALTLLFSGVSLLSPLVNASEDTCYQNFQEILSEYHYVSRLTQQERDQVVKLIQKNFADSQDKGHLKLIRNDVRGALGDPRYEDLMKAWYKDGWIRYFVIKDPQLEKVLGTIGLYKNKKDHKEALWITSLVVSEEARGLGIGQRLMEFAEDYTRQQGYKFIRLYTSDEPFMKAAQGLYDKNGFPIKSSAPQIIEGEETGYTTYFREKKL